MTYKQLKQKLPEKLLRELYSFESTYVKEKLIYGKDNIVLNDSGIQTCRFCKKQKGEVSFRKKAHVFPALMNNSKLKSNFECNNCNEKFGKYEADFGEYFSIERAVYGLTKRNNIIPTHKHPNGSIKIKEVTEESMMERYGIKTDLSEDPYVLLFSNLDSEIYDFVKNNPKSNKLNLPIVKKPYRPLNVYRVFLKIGFSLLKEEELKNFERMRQFLINDKLDVKKDQENKNQLLSISIRELPDFYRYPFACLFDKRNKNTTIDVDKIFVLFWLNRTYQIPFFSDENSKNKAIREYNYCPLAGPYANSIADDDQDTLNFLNNSNIIVENFHRTRLVKEESRVLTIEFQSPSNFEGISLMPTQSSNSK